MYLPSFGEKKNADKKLQSVYIAIFYMFIIKGFHTFPMNLGKIQDGGKVLVAILDDISFPQ